MRTALMIYAKDSFGGAERRLLRIYNEFANEGVLCDVIVYGCNENSIEKILEKADCSIKSFNAIYVFEKKIQSIKHIIHSSSYDIIHFVDTSSFNLLVAYICKIKHIRILFSICSYFIAKNLSPKSVRKITRRLLKISDHVDLLYPASYEYIHKMAGDKVTITPGTFTDLSIFKPETKEKIIIFAAARLEDSKNPMLAILAAEQIQELLREQGYSVKLLGKDYDEDKLKKFIEEKKLSDIVKIIGYVKTSEVMPRAEVFLSLQKIENYPSQSLAEAAGCGCYVIVTDVGDSRLSATEEFAEFIPSDAEKLSNAIRRFIEKSADEKLSIIKKSREYAERNYNIINSKEYFKSLLFKLVESEGN